MAVLWRGRTSRRDAVHRPFKSRQRRCRWPRNGHALALPIPILLFPEGTSTDGSQVLRFHPSLFQSAVAGAVPVTPAMVRYVIRGGVPESSLCWFGDAPFVSHLWKALGTPGFSAEVTFDTPRIYLDRRSAALVSHEDVARMRTLRQGAGD